MWTFTSKDLKTDCTVIKIWKDLAFVGIGCFLHIFNISSCKLVTKLKVFEYQNLQGILFLPCDSLLFVYGGNKGIKYCLGLENTTLTEAGSCNLFDWILAAKWLNNRQLAIVSMQNKLFFLDENLIVIETIPCPQKCIIYSAFIHKEQESSLLIFSGTVFNEIIVWCKDKILHRLKEHKGVIFSLDYNDTNGYLCSTSDDRTAIVWKCSDSLTKISMISTLNGHTARVFNCKIFDTVIITCGEDCIANVWNFDGKLLRKIEANQGDSLWSIDGNEDENYVIIGGGDSAVIKHNIHVQLKETRLSLPIPKEIPKRVVLSRKNNVIVISDSGTLYYYVFATNTWKLIAFHVDLKKYAILEVSQCKNLVSLSGFDGEIYIYKETDGLDLIAKCVSPQKARIYSFHWLSCNTFVTCSESGILSTWILNNEEIILNNLHLLPKSSERWTTAACIVDDYLVVGDRKGNLFLYKFDGIHPIFSLKKAHNYLGITQITTYEGHVFTLGRNSIVRKFSLVDDDLVAIHSDKLPFTWLTKYMAEQDIILAFSGADLVIWNTSRRCRILKYNCQGGHRSWDFNTTNDSSKFVYIRDKLINVLSLNLSALLPKTIVAGYHSWEVNDVKRIRSFIISGGEDTTLRIIKQKGDKLQMMHCLKSHLSSIRAVQVCLIERKENVETYYVLSGGGRAQIILWEIGYDVESSKMVCFERHSYYESLDRNDSEMRIMDIAVYKTFNELLVFAACSDGLIKIFRIDSIEVKLILLGNVKYKLKCIMKIDVLRIEERLIVLTAGVDGLLNVWDVTFLEQQSSSTFDLLPFHQCRLHKSGVNSMSYWKLDETRVVLLTGGDDATINLNLLNFDAESCKEKIVSSNMILDDRHCTQVSGTFITDTYFVTCSTDGKVVLYNWSLLDDVCKEVVRADFVRNYYTSVADLQGLDCDGSNLILYGKGIELVQVSY